MKIWSKAPLPKSLGSTLGNTALSLATSSFGLLLLDRIFEGINGSAKHPAPLSFVGTIALLGGHGGALLAFVLVFFALSASTRRVAHLTGNRVHEKHILSFLLAMVAGVSFYLTGRDLITGAWISGQSYASFIPPGLSLIGAGGFYLAGRLYHLRKQKGTVSSFLLLTGGSAAFLGADTFVYPAIYPAFHHLSFGVCLFLLAMAASSIGSAPLHRFPPLIRTGLRVFSTLLLASSFVIFGTLGEKRRTELLLKSRTSGYLLTVAQLHPKEPYLETILTRLEKRKPILFAGNAYDNRPVRTPKIIIPKNWNIILLLVDGMRADTLPPNRRPGQPHARAGDTPFLDEWIQSTYQFQFAYAPSNSTGRSMPTIFRGLTPPSLRKRQGIPLSSRMAQTGRFPSAVVNNYFLTAKRGSHIHRLLDGFEEVEHYRKKRQNYAVGKMLKYTRRLKGMPFFVWFHHYALHFPYFAGTSLQPKDSGTLNERYRRSLQWLDGELKQLIDGLKALDLYETTVIVLTADHGECMRRRGVKTHGAYVFDDEVLVPLYIRIPGRKGGLIPSTVGLIDLTATLTELTGEKATDTDGTSLLPLIENPGEPWQRSYYLENSSNNFLGVVHGRDKLIYFKDTDAMYRFDLVADPLETQNLFDIDGEKDQRLLSQLIYHRPDLFEEALRDADTREQLTRLQRKRHALSKRAQALLSRIEK